MIINFQEFNVDFKLAESGELKNDSANQSFTMSPSRWISTTNAKISKLFCGL